MTNISTSLFYVYLYVIITSTTGCMIRIWWPVQTTPLRRLVYATRVRACVYIFFFLFCFVPFLPFFLFMLVLLLLTPFSHLLLSTIYPHFLPYVFFSLSICLCLAATCWYHLDTMFPRCPSMCFANLMKGFAAWKHTSLQGRRVPYESLPSTVLPQSSLCRFKSKFFGSRLSIILARSAVSTSKLFHFYLSIISAIATITLFTKCYGFELLLVLPLLLLLLLLAGRFYCDSIFVRCSMSKSFAKDRSQRGKELFILKSTQINKKGNGLLFVKFKSSSLMRQKRLTKTIISTALNMHWQNLVVS